VTGGVGAVALMITLFTALLVGRHHEDPKVRELATKVAGYRASEGRTPSTRLREPVQPKISELTELQDDPRFSQMLLEDQDYVRTHLQELRDYQAYQEKLRPFARSLERIHSESELEKLANSLARLAVPAEHQPEWNQTEAALLHTRLLEDIKALRHAVAEMEDWYNALIHRGQELWSFAGQESGVPLTWPDWNRAVQELFDKADNPPHQPTDKLPRSSLPYATVFQFDRVAAARENWQTLRQKLERVRDLSAALGLAGAVPGRSPLDIPAGFQADQATGRLQELEKVYPRFAKEFNPTDLPEAILGEIRQAARTRYQHLIKAGQEVVLHHVFALISPASAEEGKATAARESLEAWRQLETWLADPKDLKAWRVLADILAHLKDPAAVDPVSALAAFLRRDRFDLIMRRLILEIPENLKVRPEGRLVIHLISGEKRMLLNYEATGEESRDPRRRVIRYVFQPVGEESLTYKPGDTLWADLPVLSAGSSGWMLTWARNRSRLYEFERLSRPPRLHPRDKENLEGETQEGILLEVTPEGGIPKVPDLLPEVPSPSASR
jgi:hypothetical protein